jgi:hypothetical protein
MNFAVNTNQVYLVPAAIQENVSQIEDDWRFWLIMVGLAIASTIVLRLIARDPSE